LNLVTDYYVVFVKLKLSLLSEKNVVDILLFLLDGKKKESDFTEIVSNYYSIKESLGKIVESGLATMTVVQNLGGKKYSARIYELTPLGLDVAADLKRANDRILGIPPESSTNCGTSEEKMDPLADE